MTQFHVDGYRPGDPFVEPPHRSLRERREGLPETADVLVVGAGPAGLVLAAQLAAFPDLRTVVVDRRSDPLEIGQADGLACRTVEMLEAFGLADHVLREGYQVHEVTFWRSDPDVPTSIRRVGRAPDAEDDLSEMPHVIVNQARVLAFLRDHMARSGARTTPFHGLGLDDLRVDTDRDDEHPVIVTLRHVEDGPAAARTSTVRARYVVGCDGAHSGTRAAIGRALEGDTTDQSWGVMDVLADTDFPDIRLKSAITSAAGSLLVIPREGGHLVRIYVELDRVRDPDMVRTGTVTPEKLATVVNRVLHPYSLEVRDVGWWSVYEVGQRLCARFDDLPGGGASDDEGAARHPRVFIAGDACHTHSAKAGQGMNVSMADTWNLGWKLASVLQGRSRSELLHTYSTERQAVARELIDFDREFSALFSAEGFGGTTDTGTFERYFRDQGRFTAGVAVRYAPSIITASDPRQERATGFPVGMRFHSATVVRLADARPMQLGHAARADGAWRLYLFADRDGPTRPGSPFLRLCAHLGSPTSPLARFTPLDSEPDAVVDVRAVVQQARPELEITAMPPVLLPRKGRFDLVDHEKVFCPDPADDVFDRRGVDRDTGALVVVRPDQYVAQVLALDDHEALTTFLEGVLRDAREVPGPAS